MQSPLRYAGSKAWLASYLRKVWNTNSQRTRLVEPFAGALNVALTIKPTHALLNDLNADLIDFWKSVQSGTFQLPPFVDDNPFLDINYYSLRMAFNKEHNMKGLSRAAMFYVINQTCFNGLWRVNEAGEFNTPYGERPYPQEFDVEAYRDVIKDWVFHSRDFTHLQIEPSDFVYVDPPYYQGFTAYTAQGFSWTDQVRLADWCITVAESGAGIAVSNSAHNEIIDLYVDRGFACMTTYAPRKIAANGSRDAALELFAIRNISLP